MHRMLVVIFNGKTAAYEGKRRLLQLDADHRIRLNAYALIEKRADGNVAVREEDAWPRALLIGTAVGSLIGMLRGPIGVLAGAMAGFAPGGIVDLAAVKLGEDFVDEISRHLAPGSFAVVAEIQEGDTNPVDTCMEAIGGTPFRRSLLQLKQTVHDRRSAAMKAELNQVGPEHAKPADDHNGSSDV